jgi:glucose/arabinose dehydrogenase
MQSIGKRNKIAFYTGVICLVWAVSVSCGQSQSLNESIGISSPQPGEVSANDSLGKIEPVTTGDMPGLLPTLTIDEPASDRVPADAVGVEPFSVTSFPDANGYYWRPVVNQLDHPLGLTSITQHPKSIFVLEQTGKVRIIQEGQLISLPFLDIQDRVRSQSSEQGLLGMAFHPEYDKNGFFFVNYTDFNGNSVVSRFSVSTEDDKQAVATSEKILLQVEQPYANHNGGMLAFGPDQYLYIGLGDGGSAGDPLYNGQSKETLLGKILRIDVDGGEAYSVPPQNPFAEGGGKPEIWIYGLRNPWRFSFDRVTGDLYIGDVGQNDWEEIDFIPYGEGRGLNLGWNFMEGNHPYLPGGENEPGLIPPAFEYAHNQGCSVTGGVVYRGLSLPAWQGVYLLGDYCSGIIWGLLRDTNGQWQSQELFQTGAQITSFGEAVDGEVYIVSYSGDILQLNER